MQEYASRGRGTGASGGSGYDPVVGYDPAAGYDPSAGYDPERDGFDMRWARNAPEHELSAHGRSVQRRLDTPAAPPRRPSLLKRLRFALYRLFHGR